MRESLLRRIVRLLSRVVAIFIMPAQLPGNAVAMFDLLTTAPLSAIKRWNLRTIGALLRQVVRSEKLTIPNDAILHRFVTQRQRYLGRGWLEQPITTADGVVLDACIKPPPRRASGERWVLFVGGNFQRYEDHLPYFDFYARDAGVGFLAFNFRGVVRSEGAITSVGDMLTDVSACVDHILARGVQPSHLLLHGFSLGGAIVALLLASPGMPRSHAAEITHADQPKVARPLTATPSLAHIDAPLLSLVSDRSFRSLPHVAYAMVRGPDAIRRIAAGARASGASASGSSSSALGSDSDDFADLADDDDDDDDDSGDSNGGVSGGRLSKPRRSALRRLLSSARSHLAWWVRGVVAWIAAAALRQLAWELCAEAVWDRVRGRKLVLYHRQDNVIDYRAASLRACLRRRARAERAESDASAAARAPSPPVGACTEVEVTHPGGGGATHDFWLCTDDAAWAALISGVRDMVGLAEGDADAEPEQSAASPMVVD